MASSMTRLARGRQPDFADDRAIAAADDELDGGADLGQLDVHVLEDARGDALALADQAEQQVLGADVVVVEPLRLVLGKRQDLARAVRELVEAIHRVAPVPIEHVARALPEMLPKAACPPTPRRSFPQGGPIGRIGVVTIMPRAEPVRHPTTTRKR